MRRVRFWLMILFAEMGSIIGLWAGNTDVLVLVNEAVPESVELGHYYAEQRSIPLDNIISLNLPREETISWKTFVESLFNPLKKQLIESGWLKSIAPADGEKDQWGRDKETLVGHRIRFLVLCKGVPLRIKPEASFVNEESFKQFYELGLSQFEKVGEKQQSQFRRFFNTTMASVDSELSVMPMVDTPVIGFVRNPLFGKNQITAAERNAVLKTARLDGPSYADARALVDHALEGERSGLRGRAYLDYAHRPGQMGDIWIKDIEKMLKEDGFDTSVNREKNAFGVSDRFDEPILYFGWHHTHCLGAIARSDFRFPPGAIGVHIHSFSAATMNSTSKHWLGPLVARGVTATLGNVYEPTLQFTHYLNIFYALLRSGASFGDAAWVSCRALSWQGVVLGDPLYRPFQHSLDDQLEDLAAKDSYAYEDSYIFLRQAGALRAKEGEDAYLADLKKAYFKCPSTALAYAMAKAYKAQDRDTEAFQALAGFLSYPYFIPEEGGLFLEVASFMQSIGYAKEALTLYVNLFEQGDMLRGVRIQAQKKGSPLALRLNEKELWTRLQLKLK